MEPRESPLITVRLLQKGEEKNCFYKGKVSEAVTENWAPRLIAKSSVNARIWRTSFQFLYERGKNRMCAGEAGAGTSSLMDVPP
jgi:hypothetical protein